ncbi:MAG: CPBP family intramembrane metalloprotease [Planctomycetes bacterium]|nr:CPBP family intramembrane metalloprotease [Planctomycetota bacterium]
MGIVLAVYAAAVIFLAAVRALGLSDVIWVPLGLTALALLALALSRCGAAQYGIRFGRPRDEIAALACALLFLLLVAGFFLLWRAMGRHPGIPSSVPRTWSDAAEWLGRWWDFTWRLALPEELFFRGFLQSELRRFDRRSIRILAVRLGPSFLIADLLFAIAHIAPRGDPFELTAFFPGLIFGWLRERGGSIVAPTVFHGLYNLGTYALRGWI